MDAQLGVHTRVARSPCTMGQGMGTEDKRDHELRAKLSPYRSPRYPRILSSNLDFQELIKNICQDNKILYILHNILLTYNLEY